MKLLPSINELAAVIAAARTIFTSGCAAEIPGLAEVLAEAALDAELSGIFIPGVNRSDYTGLSAELRCQTYFMTPQMSPSLGTERLAYAPLRYRDIVQRYMTEPVDLAIVMLSRPDADGYCSYGVTSDFAPLVVPRAKVTVGVINQQMPRVVGEQVAVQTLDYTVELDQPLIEVPVPKRDATSERIAANVAGFIGDDATVQLGLGSIPGAVAAVIRDRRRLKVRSGLIDDAVLLLEQAGALCQQTPILGGVALGEQSFYGSLDCNIRFDFRSVATTHNLAAIAATDQFVAVNGALQVDLFGQVNSNVLQQGFISGPGGLPEFVAGALMSPGGRSIIALSATAKQGAVSRIVPQLEGGMPSVALADADVVASEFGVVQLRGKCLAERARAMVAIADPGHREALERALPALLYRHS
ncbi:MAG: acetyl-CoA hydrolase [Gammaproteobacteria bacterium]|nr:acetyl-CoA hydrolase [Gammaproteobacteria bacterium]